MLDKLQIIQQRFDEVSDLIIQPDIISDQKRYILLNKEYKDLTVLMERIFYTTSLIYLTQLKIIMYSDSKMISKRYTIISKTEKHYLYFAGERVFI